MHPPGSRHRVDIQAMRGIAVLAVVVYHAKLGMVSAGFLGVDIFFVLSGFLITSVINTAVQDRSFSYRSFLLRRARRLLPAAFVTFFVTALLAPLLLATRELQDFWAQLAGALTFSANFVLTSQSSYFSGAAELKPLLHVWSLAVEEQYYFLLPALFLLLPKRVWWMALVLLMVLSFALCISKPGEASTFFLLPTRAWEMLIGSLGVFLVDIDAVRQVARKLVVLQIAVLLGCLFYAMSWVHPGPQALLVCLATLGLILARHPALQHGVIAQTLEKVGNISYSLYLVHWPLFAFYNNIVFADQQSTTQIAIRVALIGVSFALAWALNRYVEEPCRRGAIACSPRAAMVGAGAGIMAVGISQLAAPLAGSEEVYAYARRPNYGFASECANATDFVPKSGCRNSARPTVLVWGDSYAMHLVPGLVHQDLFPDSLVQATRNRCGPLLGAASIEFNSEKWARECIRFNDAVLAYLAARPEIHTVILSSPLTQTTKGAALLERVSRAAPYTRIEGASAMGLAGLARSVEAVRALGRRVILVSPPPMAGFDVGRCLERQERGLLLAGVDGQCRIPVYTYKKLRAPVLALLDAAEKRLQLPVVRLDAVLCDPRFCRTRIVDVRLYRDEGHLSYDGAKALFALPATQLALRRALQRKAPISQASVTADTRSR